MCADLTSKNPYNMFWISIILNYLQNTDFYGKKNWANTAEAIYINIYIHTSAAQ